MPSDAGSKRPALPGTPPDSPMFIFPPLFTDAYFPKITVLEKCELAAM
jgi:hypothetical protein